MIKSSKPREDCSNGAGVGVYRRHTPGAPPPAAHDGLGNPFCIYLACEHCVVPVLDFEERYIDAVQYVRVKPWIWDHDSEMR